MQHKMEKIIQLLLMILVLSNMVSAWDDCPYGEVDCEYPGDCGRYVDTNQDRICDSSQPLQGDTKNINNDSDFKQEMKYHLIPISAILVLFYVISHILSIKKVISIANHRRFWNILLLSSFILSGISGIILIININSGLNILMPLNLIFWHVETGIAMFAITIFHIIWHGYYFKLILGIRSKN